MLIEGPILFFWNRGPKQDYQVHLYFGAWLLYQAALYQFLPTKLGVGQLTPAGHLLKYRTNGLLAWVITHVVFGVWALHGCVDAAIIARNWEPLIVTTNVFGFALAGFAYFKAHLFSTHEGDRKFSGKLLTCG